MIAQEETLVIDAARRREYAQLINESGQHLLSVVNGILDMSKMESGNFEISPELFAPRGALIELVLGHAHQAQLLREFVIAIENVKRADLGQTFAFEHFLRRRRRGLSDAAQRQQC